MLERISAFVDRAIGPLNREDDGLLEEPRWQPNQSRPGVDRCEREPDFGGRVEIGRLAARSTKVAADRAGLAETARMFLGKSKAEMNGTDCSGFIRMTAKLTGRPIDKLLEHGKGPNGCSRLLNSMDRVGEDEAKTGDLVFFKIDDDKAKVASHVGILVVNDDGTKQILHMTNAGVRLNNFHDKATRGGHETWADKMVPEGFARLPAS